MEQSAIYRIHVASELDSSWSSFFDGLSIAYDHGQTVLVGPVQDQAALHGLLARIRDLGLVLLLVRREAEGAHETWRRP